VPFARVGNAEGATVMVKHIVDAKARFGSLAKPRADTGTSTGRWMLAVLGVADRTRLRRLQQRPIESAVSELAVIRLATVSAITGSRLHCRRRLVRAGVLA
jgi:hypothetical protein